MILEIIGTPRVSFVLGTRHITVVVPVKEVRKGGFLLFWRSLEDLVVAMTIGEEENEAGKSFLLRDLSVEGARFDKGKLDTVKGLILIVASRKQDPLPE